MWCSVQESNIIISLFLRSMIQSTKIIISFSPVIHAQSKVKTVIAHAFILNPAEPNFFDWRPPNLPVINFVRQSGRGTDGWLLHSQLCPSLYTVIKCPTAYFMQANFLILTEGCHWVLCLIFDTKSVSPVIKRKRHGRCQTLVSSVSDYKKRG